MPEAFDSILPPELDRLLAQWDPQAAAQVAQVLRRESEARQRAEEALRQAEAALRETTDRFRAVSDHARAAFGILDGTRIVYANAYFAELTGYSLEEIIGMDFRRMTHPSFHQLMLERAGRRLAGLPVPDHYEFLAVTKSGQERWVDFSPAVTELNGKRVIIGSGFDVTDRKRAEEAASAARVAAERAMAAAEQASRAKDHFLAVLSHELRTPLTPVLAVVSVLLQERADLDAEMRADLEMVRRNVEMEARLIDDLLDVTRIARGKIELRKEPIELCRAIAGAVEVCRGEIEARGLHFGVELGEAAPYIVEADAGRLQQVFWNLLKNAVKFTPPGGCVHLRCRREQAGWVRIEVQDSGIGIEPEMLPRLFTAFEQAGRDTTRQFGGLGLGLAISKAIVEMHGGSIEACSEGRGKGATFAVKLPVVEGLGFRVQGSASSSLNPEPPGKTLNPRSLRILLVEDHLDTARLMKQLLVRSGHAVQHAGDVATALERAGPPDEQRFDLLLSDLGLPDGSGIDLMGELRRRGHTLAGIVLSGYGQEEDLRRSREAGFVAHRAIDEHPAGNLAIVSHGTIISLFIAQHTNESPFLLWRRLGLPSFVVLSLPDLKLLEMVEKVD